MEIKYVKKFEDQYTKNNVDPNSIQLLEQDGPTCRLYSVLNNFMLQTRIQLSDRDEIDFFRYAVKCGLDLDN
jgi:hypothetical protein